jgi:hypothetical protein
MKDIVGNKNNAQPMKNCNMHPIDSKKKSFGEGQGLLDFLHFFGS